MLTPSGVRHISNWRRFQDDDFFDICQEGLYRRPHAEDAADDRHVCPGLLRSGGGRSHVGRAALEVALRLKALADPVRVKIMSLLFGSADGEENSGDLAAVLGLAESTVSHHLAQLRKAGLVDSQRRGMNVYHRAHRDALSALCAVLDPTCCT